MKHKIKVIKTPFADDVAAVYAFPWKHKTRWLVAAKANRQRYAEIAYTDDCGKIFHLVTVGGTKGEGALEGGAFTEALGILWFATNKKNLYRSRDGGKTWELKAQIK